MHILNWVQEHHFKDKMFIVLIYSVKRLTKSICQFVSAFIDNNCNVAMEMKTLCAILVTYIRQIFKTIINVYMQRGKPIQLNVNFTYTKYYLSKP